MSSTPQQNTSPPKPELKPSRISHLSKKIVITIFCIILATLAIDQVSKTIVVSTMPVFPAAGSSINVIGDFFRITHITNNAILFSIGRDLETLTKRILFTVLPLLLLGWLIYIVIFDKTLNPSGRYAFALVAGGGLGNLSDRLFRGGGVVDFIDIRFYGIFGFERWPTFNVADSAVVIGVLLFLVFSFIKKKA